MSKRNMNTLNLDQLNTFDILKKINEEDKKIAYCVEKELSSISEAVELIVDAFKNGGRLIYIGSGTSGKLAVIDASECPPTFGVNDEMVQGILSGGKEALYGWLEHTEDDEELAINDVKNRNVTSKDILVGITASGNTPYVKSALEYGKSIGCKTIGVMCNRDGLIKTICDISICVEVGPEVIMGSTRMKAGTAQKMILNMLSTTSMIKLGKTYSNLMVNLKPINKKLKNRVIEIVQLGAEVDRTTAEKILEQCNYNPKIAIVAIKKQISIEQAKEILDNAKDNVANALI